MFAVLILVCVPGTVPSQCTATSAVHRIVGPPADNELACMRQSQMFAAPLAIVHQGDVVRIVCTRKRAFAGQTSSADHETR